MEISSSIHTITSFKFQLPFFTHFHLPSKLKYPLQNSLTSLHSTPQKWLLQPTITIRALSDGAAAPLDVTENHNGAVGSFDADASFAIKKKATDICSDLKGTSIFLVGMKNAMKTKVGQVLAESLRYYYFDSDSLVEDAAGEDSSGKSFKERDEAGFRESETEVLKQLSSMGRLVVNAGNGAVKGVTNLAHLRHGLSICIDVPLDMIAKEFIGGADQSGMSNISTPDNFSEALARLSQLYEEYRSGYATADATISLQRVAANCAYDEFENVTAEDMALEILKEIEKLTRVKKMMAEAGRPF